MNFALVSSLARGKWAIDPYFAINQLGLVQQILTGQVMVERDHADIPPFLLHPVASVKGASPSSRKNVIAITSLKGALMKNDQECGPAGMATIGENLQYLDRRDDVIGHVLIFDTPGGTVDGTQVLGQTIKNLSKPSIAFVDGLCASAGLWLASNCNEIIASTDLDEIGSVGVLLSFQDFQPAYEKMGVKFHNIVSSLSPDKVKMWEEIRAGKYDTYIKERLDPIAEKFQTIIKENFPKVEDQHLGGKMFHARDLIGIMVSKIGSLNDAFDRVTELAQNNPVSPVLQTNTLSSMKFPKLFALLAISELAMDEGFSSLSEDHLTSIENALPDADAEVEDLSDDLAEANAMLAQRDQEIQSLQDLINGHEQAIAQRDQTIAQLRAQPAEEPAAFHAQADSDASQNENGPVVTDDMDTLTAMKKVKEAYGL